MSYNMTSRVYKLLHLLESVNGGAVSYDMIRAVIWPKLSSNKRDLLEIYPYISRLRSLGGYGIIHHKNVGYQLAPYMDETWKSSRIKPGTKLAA